MQTAIETPTPQNPPLRIDLEIASDRAAVEALVLAAFGPGRFAKTAERLRERAHCVAGFTAREDGRVVGSVRLWSIRVGATPALFLGPIAVAGERRRGGLGADLVQACVEHARAQSVSGILLVGDPWFARFGFVVAPDVTLPGPVDARRVMWLMITAPAASGLVLPS